MSSPLYSEKSGRALIWDMKGTLKINGSVRHVQVRARKLIFLITARSAQVYDFSMNMLSLATPEFPLMWYINDNQEENTGTVFSPIVNIYILTPI